jgi:flagellar motor switch protein FliM
MAELLDQNEIDALLSAVDDGEVAGPDDSGPIQIFSSHNGSSSNTDIEIRPYDFKRPERVSKDQMRALENLHEGFSRNYGAALSGFLRTIVEVKVANIEQMTFSEFTHSLPNPTCFNLIGADQLEGNLCFEISPLIIYPIIDRLLGGSNADLFIPQRPLTDIELRLVGKILDLGMNSLHDAWEPTIPLKFALEDSESNPQLVQIVPPNEVVVVIGFEMKMGGRAGTMSLCIPFKVIEPVMEKLGSQSWGGSYKKHGKDDVTRSKLAINLEAAHLTTAVILADTTMKLNELVNLQVGDIIITEKPASSPLSLMIEKRRKFIGNIGQYHGNRAFKVLRNYQPKDRV